VFSDSSGELLQVRLPRWTGCLSQARRTQPYWHLNTAVGVNVWLTIPASLPTDKIIPCPQYPDTINLDVGTSIKYR